MVKKYPIWYSYVLNNPLKFIDPSGYYPLPSTENQYWGSPENWAKLGGAIGSQFYVTGQHHPSGGWSYSSAARGYVNQYSGATMSGNDFNLRVMPGITSPDHTQYGNDAAISYYGTLGHSTQKLGNPDVLGSQWYLRTDPSGAMSTYVSPFWRETGSYYNELYYFSGLVAYDTYAALASMSGSKNAEDFTGDLYTNITESPSYRSYRIPYWTVYEKKAVGSITGSGPTVVKNGIVQKGILVKRGPLTIMRTANGVMLNTNSGFGIGVSNGMLTTSMTATRNGLGGIDYSYVNVTNQYQLNLDDVAKSFVAAYSPIVISESIYLLRLRLAFAF